MNSVFIPKYLLFFSIQEDQCFPNNTYNLEALGNFNNNAIITWNFGNSTTATNSSGITTQVSFVDIGTQTINLTIENNGCTAIHSQNIEIYPPPTANFPEQSVFCDGSLNLELENNSLNANSYFWNFGDLTTNQDTSILFTPLTYTYPNTGSFDIMLIANQHNLCFDTLIRTYNLYPLLTSSFNLQAIQCLTNNLFTLNAIGNYSSNATFNWNFNDLSIPQSTTNPTQISYPDTGKYLVGLTIEDFGCTSNYIDTLIVYPNPILKFTFTPNEGCQPLQVSFYDSSYANTPLQYNWDFGDGHTSNEVSPNHTYQDSGIFDVSLTINTTEGCIDTKNLFLSDTITVYPKPFADFKINAIETFFYNNVINVKDLSNTFYQEFNFGDGSIFTAQNVEYSYLDTGHYQFSQIVTTEHGCKDTLYQNIWIKPDFLIFTPNSFTPNNDGLNDIFKPQLQGIMEYNLQIFNRWGQIIFESDNLDTGWDGTVNNTPSQEDTYIWKIRAKTVDYLLYTPTGHINLIR